MIRIHIKFSRTTGLISAFDSIQHLDIDVHPPVNGQNRDVSLSPDDNGTTFFCSVVNGLPSPHHLNVKLFTFNDETAHEEYLRLLGIQSNILIYQSMLEDGYDNPFKMEMFRAIPQFIFEGHFQGIRLYGYASVALDRDWRMFRKIQDKISGEEGDMFYNLPVEAKRIMALDLIAALSYLNECEIAFVSLQDRNLMINSNNRKITFVDYEKMWIVNLKTPLSGMYYECTNTPQPVLVSGWIPPEVRGKLLKCEKHTHPTSEMGYYTLAVALFNLFADFPTYGGDRISLNKIIRLHVPETWLNGFKHSFLSEYNISGKRLNYTEWAKILQGEQEFKNSISDEAKNKNGQISIELFVDKDVIIDGMPITLSWNIVGQHERVFLNNGIGSVTGMNEIELNPNQDSTYEITVENFNEHAKDTVTVLVYPKPPIPPLKLPELDLSHLASFEIEEDIVPKLKLPVDLVNINLPSLDLKCNIELDIPVVKIYLNQFNLNVPPLAPIELNISFADQSILDSLNIVPEELNKHPFNKIYKQVKERSQENGK